MNRSAADATFRYSAFISYSRDDERWAKWLQSALESYRVPRRLIGSLTTFGVLSRRLAPVFRDRSDLSATTDLGETITSALEASATLIVICSPSAIASRWVNEEIRVFRRLRGDDRIFCVIVAGVPNASDISGQQAEECFPPALRFVAAADGAPTGRRYEPTAADARPGGDGKGNVKLKILAGLLDVGFDVLKQREQRRRIRRLTAVTALSLVMMLITTGLSITARNARIAAEQRQREAETLVDFMLGDLNDKLRQVQRLDILEAVDNQAMAYFLARPSTSLSDQALALRVKALQKIGNVREDQGKLPAAMGAYRAAAAAAAELARRAPGDADREAAYAETLHHLGNAYWFQGDLSRALECFQQAISLLQRAVTLRPSDTGAAVLAYARINEGRVREARGEFADAKSLYEAASSTFTSLTARHPGEIRWQSDLADAADSLAKVAKEQGQLTQALAGYRDVYRIRKQILAKSPSDRDSQENLLITDATLGGTLALCGDEDAAAQNTREAVRVARELVAFDATQSDWRLELARYSRLLGGITRSTGRLDEAARADNEALTVLTELVAMDGTNTAWRRELARARIESARLHLATRDIAGAQTLLDTALATIQGERANDTVNRNLRLYEAEALIALGEAAAQRQNLAAARERWQQARGTLEGAARVGADPEFLAAWSQALLLLGDTDTARPVLDQLATMGYRTPDFERLLKATRQSYRTRPVALQCGSDSLGASGADELH
jgi:eukaryotic-like serine/threonine-protein kinase